MIQRHSADGRILVVVAVLGLVVASCSGGDSTTTTVATTPPTTATSTTVAVSASTTQPGSTTTQGLAAVPPASYIVAGPDSVNLVETDGSVTVLLEGGVELAMDDGAGGLLFQEQVGQVFETSSLATRVWWIRAFNDAPRELLVPAADQYLELVDAAEVVAGEAAVFYLRREAGDDLETSQQTLRRLGVAFNEVTELAVVGGFESNSQLSLGGDLFVMSWAGEGICGLSFLDLAGHEVPSPPGIPPAAQNGGECGTVEESADLAPDDATLAFVDPTVDGSFNYVGEEVAVVDLATGEELMRLTAWEGEAVWSVRDLDLSGTILIVNRRDATDFRSSLPAWIADFSGPEPVVTEAPMAGVARLLKAPLEIALPQS